jgi:aminoglycoside phosphotransferase (APT) family kinase protein
VPPAHRQIFGHSFIDVLARLHSVDPDAGGPGDLGKKDGYISRQLKTWYRSWTASVEDAKYDDERAHALQKYLLDNEPDQGPARVVHGDYGTHNVLVGADGHIAAVVDWEISTLGDPLADLAYALNQWTEPGDPVPFRANPPTALPGFPSRAELAQRYAQRTGRDLSRLDYYVAFNRWKSAAIVHGVYARYMAGKKSTEGVDMEGLRARIENFLALSQQAVARLERRG